VQRRLESEETLLELAEQSGAVLQALGRMHADARELCTLDDHTYALVRFAAQVALGTPPAAYLATLAIGDEAGVTVDELRGVLTAIAPVVGGTRVVAALAGTGEAWRLANGR
jgi:alkylhydroperoxidase/carboxymuconolactone decarboxylase family protein YurZ